jgi:mono/diheme cytochrome c family protein
MTTLEYTPEVLAVVCPQCHGVRKCLEPVKDGSHFIEQPHKERVELAAKLVEGIK